jgi:methionyl-tRNA formyltransferase
MLSGQQLKIHAAKEGTGSGAPGTVIRVDKKNLEVACGEGSLFITNLQLPGKKAMDISAFLLGNKIEEGSVLG